ncbi:MAG: MFS transporter [Dehalococcoidia bacterium]|nr:MAG: MFS transporter [Dehalococcoidia bacterium]
MSDKRSKKNVILLGMVSLFTDLSSQMIYPLMPEFLVSIGAKKAVIGIIEGIAESTASLFRPIFGRLSDKLKKRKLFIYLGYGLSTISKPFLFFANSWTAVLFIKFFERVGKASRTPARDALISTSVSASKKGKAFGFHRAMDRIGAIGGPLIAMLILFFFDNNVRLVFLLSVVPATVALFFIKFVRETTPGKDTSSPVKKKSSLRSAPFIYF